MNNRRATALMEPSLRSFLYKQLHFLFLLHRAQGALHVILFIFQIFRKNYNLQKQIHKINF